MNIYRINTTAFSEEDFYLMTDLTEDEITSVITPIVLAERNKDESDEESNEDAYDDESLALAISFKYPNNVIEMYYDFDTITI